MADTLARKVNKAKWDNQLESKNKIISADAITSCLRTSENNMSVWDVENIEDAVLALACLNESLIVIDIVVLSKKRLNELSIEINAVKSYNPVSDLNEKHFDIINLDYDKLGVIANEIADEIINNNDFIVRFPKPAVREIVKNAINSGRITISQLKKNLQSEFLQITPQG